MIGLNQFPIIIIYKADVVKKILHRVIFLTKCFKMRVSRPLDPTYLYEVSKDNKGIIIPWKESHPYRRKGISDSFYWKMKLFFSFLHHILDETRYWRDSRTIFLLICVTLLGVFIVCGATIICIHLLFPKTGTLWKQHVSI